MNCKFSLSNNGVQRQESHPVWIKRLLLRGHRALLQEERVDPLLCLQTIKLPELEILSARNSMCPLIATFYCAMVFVTQG